MSGQTPTSGMDLKLNRVRRSVTATRLGRAMGFASHVRVSQIESRAVVPPAMVARYLAALEALAPERDVA